MKFTAATAAMVIAFCATQVVATPTPSMRFRPDVMRKATGEEKHPYIIPQAVLANMDLKRCLAEWDAPNNKNNTKPDQNADKVMQQLQKAFKDAKYTHIHIKAEPKRNNKAFVRKIEKYIETLKKVVENAKKNNKNKRDLDAPADESVDAPADEFVGEAPADESAGEAPADESAGEAPADESAGEAPADEFVGEAPADESAGEAPADEYAGEAPADEYAGEAPADESVDAPADESVDAPADESTDAPADEEAPADEMAPIYKRDVKIQGGCKRPEDVLVALLQVELKQGPGRFGGPMGPRRKAPRYRAPRFPTWW
ncbi:hypothetical protein P167DRAFT_606217 [Morchella conica CCBAS932]|uniref:Uncharacterized protein n=1 Tax=Morchella conica CCBAS932 TaxID=1392247 RepID=A0A3N4KN15_9PEZI|nr:hypothetical protein P167DRAFT_606217 [Morchella conica CCBAS932]